MSSRSTHEAAFAIVASVPSVPTFAASVAFVKRTPDAGTERPIRGDGVDWRYATVPAERNDASDMASCSALIQSPDATPSKTRSSSMSPTAISRPARSSGRGATIRSGMRGTAS